VVVLLNEYLMASWSAVQVPSTPKTQAPVLPELGLSSYPTVAAKSQQAEGIKLRYSHLTVRKMANSLEGEMDTKPKDTKPEDLDLELAVFAAP
jgi:hypothetical protein